MIVFYGDSFASNNNLVLVCQIIRYGFKSQTQKKVRMDTKSRIKVSVHLTLLGQMWPQAVILLQAERMSRHRQGTMIAGTCTTTNSATCHQRAVPKAFPFTLRRDQTVCILSLKTDSTSAVHGTTFREGFQHPVTLVLL